MIRFFVLTGLVGGAVVAWLTTAGVGPVGQMPPPESLLTRFREEGYVPEKVNLPIDETAEELAVFTVPPRDEVELEKAEEAFGDMMSGMDMGGMNMGGTDSGSMNMGGGDAGAMTGMNMAGGGSDTMDMNAGDSGAMNMGEGGLLVTEDGPYDREIVLTMSEWKFSDMQIDVKAGETIKFTVRNGGQIPHEFMFMSMPLMQAVNYRATRADWNLYEHEALFEQALVLPGGAFSFVLKVTQPGSWMFMCMLPYHMQMGMMGQMATEGMAMDM